MYLAQCYWTCISGDEYCIHHQNDKHGRNCPLLEADNYNCKRVSTHFVWLCPNLLWGHILNFSGPHALATTRFASSALPWNPDEVLGCYVSDIPDSMGSFGSSCKQSPVHTLEKRYGICSSIVWPYWCDVCLCLWTSEIRTLLFRIPEYHWILSEIDGWQNSCLESAKGQGWYSVNRRGVFGWHILARINFRWWQRNSGSGKEKESGSEDLDWMK